MTVECTIDRTVGSLEVQIYCDCNTPNMMSIENSLAIQSSPDKPVRKTNRTNSSARANED